MDALGLSRRTVTVESRVPLATLLLAKGKTKEQAGEQS